MYLPEGHENTSATKNGCDKNFSPVFALATVSRSSTYN